MTPQEEFEQIISRSDRLLCKAFLASNTPTARTSGVQIRFPHYRGGGVRVSEQEARFIVTSELAKSSLLYSIETPTTETYQFTGGFGLSAKTDVTVDTPEGDGLWNIEFKAHGFTEDREDKFAIQKDLEKLLREPRPAFWFHTFAGVDKSTLRAAWGAFLCDINQILDRLHNVEIEINEKPLVFHACILREQFSVQRFIMVPQQRRDRCAIPNSPGPTYEVRQGRLASHEEKDGWKFNHHG